MLEWIGSQLPTNKLIIPQTSLILYLLIAASLHVIQDIAAVEPVQVSRLLVDTRCWVASIFTLGLLIVQQVRFELLIMPTCYRLSCREENVIKSDLG